MGTFVPFGRAGDAADQVVDFERNPHRAIDEPAQAGYLAPAPWQAVPRDFPAVPAASAATFLVDEAEMVAAGPADPVSGPWYKPPDAHLKYDHWQILPEGLFYRSYLAGAKEPRLGTQIVHDDQWGMLMDSTLGGRVGLLRYGHGGPEAQHGWQLDFAGAAMLRQEFDHDLDVVAVDFRAGVPLTYANEGYRMKIAYYHLSSHLVDEFMLRTGTARINYSRDVIVWGHSLHFGGLRFYGEIGYGFVTDDGAEPWELQFGIEYSPAAGDTVWGAPFFAINAHLREEVDFGGNLVVQIGRQWRRLPYGKKFYERNALGTFPPDRPSNSPVLRLGLHYYNGKSPQFEFFDQFEQQIGLGLWYDF